MCRTLRVEIDQTTVMHDSVRMIEMPLEEYLEKNGVWHRFIEKAETIHTADAAQMTGIDLQRITKNLVS